MCCVDRLRPPPKADMAAAPLGVTNGTILNPKCDILFMPDVVLGAGEAMRRREFITLLGGAAAWPLAARGQVTRKRPLIGRLSSGSRDSPIIARFIERFLLGMRELGYVEGRDFDMTYGWADFHPDQLPRVAAELVNLAPDVILTGATIEAVAARKATATIPIVVPVLADPVELGFTTSDARPTGNVTGIMPYVKGLPQSSWSLRASLSPARRGSD